MFAFMGMWLMHLCKKNMNPDETLHIRPRSAVSNRSGYRCVSDCRSMVASSIQDLHLIIFSFDLT